MRDKKSTLLNIIIIVLTVILFFMTMFLVAKTKPRTGSSYGPDTAEGMIRMLERGKYTDLLQSKYMNEMMGVTEADNDSYTVPYAAAEYYEAAFNRKGMSDGGDEEGASVYAGRMSDARKALGKYEYVADDIDAFLH